jgi:hypothetical protein
MEGKDAGGLIGLELLGQTRCFCGLAMEISNGLVDWSCLGMNASRTTTNPSSAPVAE